jgi:hypothetical protein
MSTIHFAANDLLSDRRKAMYPHHPHSPLFLFFLHPTIPFNYKIALKAINVLIYNLVSTIDFVFRHE